MYVILGGAQWWNLDDVFESVGEAKTRLVLEPGVEVTVADIDGKGKACYQRALQKWDARMLDLEEAEVNKQQVQGKKRAKAAENDEEAEETSQGTSGTVTSDGHVNDGEVPGSSREARK